MVFKKHSKTNGPSQEQLMTQAKDLFKNTNPSPGDTSASFSQFSNSPESYTQASVKNTSASPTSSSSPTSSASFTSAPSQKSTYIAITIVTFLAVVFFHFFSLGWGIIIAFPILPVLIALYFVPTIMFSYLPVKPKRLTILFYIIIVANLLHAITYVDFGDVPGYTGLLGSLQDATDSTLFTPLNFSMLSLLVAIIAEIALLVLVIITKKKLKTTQNSKALQNPKIPQNPNTSQNTDSPQNPNN